MPEPSVWLPAAHSSSARRHALIYFICGNPGLIEFYRDFLTYLRGLLDGADHSGSTTAYDIFGKNLPGFRDEDHEPFSPTNPPLHLDVVIEKTYDDVMSRRRDGGGEYDEVVLLGHSLGTFISVEIFQRHSVQAKAKLTLSHGLLLFPTVTHLALSPSGKRFTFVMGTIPLLERYGHVWARLLLGLVPAKALTLYMTRVLGFTARAAGTTAGWLKSRDGVWQTLSLARDELVMIAGEERWGEEIWEAAQQEEDGDGDGDGEQQRRRRRFFMFYAKKDHWIADHVRDEFVERMRRRGEEGEGMKGRVPKTEIDEGGIRHDFCTKDDSSLEVAQRVSGWIGEIDRARRS
ncbi:hypothetical protein NLU13_8008 [Sarocladium strictum]|uniref:Lipid droplet-associated hydrolase n=1 Tax=Sarocladium strictum TaxID=5046 RepID=A0AA39GAU5_SARSR|nr:hypothetical protein NLU13_8008 [Sarocladium strictum]